MSDSVLITAIICGTVLALALLGMVASLLKKDNDKKDEDSDFEGLDNMP